MIQSKQFRTNVEALSYVRQCWGDDLPFIRFGEYGEDLWNAIELERVATGADTEAP